MLQSLVSGDTCVRVRGEASFDEFTGSLGDIAPVLERRKGIVCHQDGLHFFEVGVAVEGCVTAKKEVCDDANSPDITFVKDKR